MELASLAILIDSRPVRTAKEWLDELAVVGGKAEKSMDGVGAGGRKAAAGTDAATASARSAAAAMAQQDAAARRLTATIHSYASIVVGAFGVREIIQMADEWGQYASRLEIATKGTGDFVEVQQRMLDISNRVYKSFGNSAEMYIRTAKSLEQLGYSSKQAGDLVETLQYSLTVSAADSQKSSSVIDALSKSILTGKVVMEQFNTIVAYNPRLQQAMADAITNGSLSALQKLVADGKLTVTQLMKVTSEMERLGQEADHMPVTMEDAMQRMNNKLTAFFGKVNQSTGAVNIMTDAMDGLGDALDKVDISAIARDFAAISTTWDLISTKAVEAWDAVDEFGKQFQSFLGVSDDGVRSLGDSIVTSFEQSFLDTAKELDMLYDAVFGTIARLGSGFRTLGENIASAFKWAFDWAKFYVQSILFDFQQTMVAITGQSYNMVLPSEPEKKPYFKDLREEADSVLRPLQQGGGMNIRFPAICRKRIVSAGHGLYGLPIGKQVFKQQWVFVGLVFAAVGACFGSRVMDYLKIFEQDGNTGLGSGALGNGIGCPHV
ncbi:tape measure protein [Alcaligenaceae bacterium]|nr:tape measure protein [Alcaligenaceae bacterium]